VALAWDEGESESMVVRDREKRETATKERAERWTEDGGPGRERRKKAKKRFRGENAVDLVSLNNN
jgi:hypothetical protein